MSGRVILIAWVALVAVLYALTLTFITPATAEARLVTSVLFLFCGNNVTCAGIIVWTCR